MGSWQLGTKHLQQQASPLEPAHQLRLCDPAATQRLPQHSPPPQAPSSSSSKPTTTTIAIMADFNAIARKLYHALDPPSGSCLPLTRRAIHRVLLQDLRRGPLPTCAALRASLRKYRTWRQADELTHTCSAKTPCSPLSSRPSSVPPTSSPSSRYASTYNREKQGLYVIAPVGQKSLIHVVNTGASLPAHRAPGRHRRRAAQQRERWHPRRCQRRTSGMTHQQSVYDEKDDH